MIIIRQSQRTDKFYLTAKKKHPELLQGVFFMFLKGSNKIF